MNFYDKDIEELESYLDSSLSPDAAAQLELRLKAEPSLARKLESLRKLSSQIHDFGRKQALLQMSEEFHAEMISENQISYSKFWIFKGFWRRHYTTMSVAASVALLTIFSSLYILSRFNQAEQVQHSGYQVLKREVDRLKKQHKVLSNDIKTIENGVPAPIQVEDHTRFGGTGFILNKQGYLLTNYHLVAHADSIVAEAKGMVKGRFKAQLIFADSARDLALLKIADVSAQLWPALPYRFRSSPPKLGESIYTLAYTRDEIAYGEGSLSAKTGYEGDTNSCQISIPVNPGNSGGPLFDQNGKIIGMISGKQMDMDNVGFAITNHTIANFLLQAGYPQLASSVFANKKHAKSSANDRIGQIEKVQNHIVHIKVY